MNRFILKQGDKFIKSIYWTAGVVPSFQFDKFEQAEIYREEYFDVLIEGTGKTRKEELLEQYPDIEFLEMKITI
ncbi:hypothetical protein AAGG74_15385 [Bacillus mexicanus]|uniref:hypothetical protein n=1 Tax=Bacillus mexicanus TaxID=2834415 RepID=UPI003D1B8937